MLWNVEGVCVHYAVPERRPGCPCHTVVGVGVWVLCWCLDGVSVVIAMGKRPVPFRTRKLSLSAPMVLPGVLGGRVGRRRTFVLLVAVIVCPVGADR